MESAQRQRILTDEGLYETGEWARITYAGHLEATTFKHGFVMLVSRRVKRTNEHAERPMPSGLHQQS